MVMESPTTTSNVLLNVVKDPRACATGDGNLALNTNPMPDGRIEPAQAERVPAGRSVAEDVRRKHLRHAWRARLQLRDGLRDPRQDLHRFGMPGRPIGGVAPTHRNRTSTCTFSLAARHHLSAEASGGRVCGTAFSPVESRRATNEQGIKFLSPQPAAIRSIRYSGWKLEAPPIRSSRCLEPKKMMTSRERVHCAFAHQEPDRVPVWAGCVAGILGEAKGEWIWTNEDSASA